MTLSTNSAESPNSAEFLDSAAPMPGQDVVIDGVTRRYGRNLAVDNVSCDIQHGAITGLLGRNGSGKTTLLRLIAGQEFVTGGRVTVFGANPVENSVVAHRMALIREDQCYPDIQVRQALSVAQCAFHAWDHEFAARLMKDFELPPKRKIKRLSRGMRSALGIVIGLASRAELTLLDEPIAGLDPVARQMFYDHLLADYAAHPRTFVISTHLIDEVAGLLERVLLMRRGKVVIDGPADDLRGSVVVASGPRDAVESFAAEHGQQHIEVVGRRARATIHRPLAGGDEAAAAALGVTVEPITLQQLLVQQDGPDSRPTRDVAQGISA